MESTTPATSSTKETTNYACLCRLLIDVGNQALRDTLDAIHAPANLHAVLAANKPTLQGLRSRRIISATQWGKLFPVIHLAVSSKDFDITLLMVLLRNLCGLPSPITGWDTLPAATDMTREADIARIKYFRNIVYAHAEQASVDDTTFNAYWQDIRDTLVRLGGDRYRAPIDNLETECMDPEIEDHYKQLLSEWKKDEDNIKDELKEIGTTMKDVMKKLDDLTAATVTANRKESSDEGEL
ncbi:E3 ubiquitin-protein ligase DZIP3-like [Orbicella faveolata]|uniref:E3 ubiquitin-protein ligase DZIP3-like n=1 Tax=Orbicella faveolata TaxID=48498 RepID=UPI0009E47E8D|nr:E3 ubiquitin-protein ligase DZIP3-like [Orbicella faveolata]